MRIESKMQYRKMGKRIVFCFLVIVSVVVIAIGIFINQPEFGSAPQGERKARILASPHYRDGEFKNIEPIEQVIVSSNPLSGLKEFFFPTKGVLVPDNKIPSKKTNLKALNSSENVVIWMGHSSYYIQVDGKKILIDPVLSDYASPISFINKAFAGSNVYSAEDVPDDIDVVLISHDHWDHLDYPTIKVLKPKIKQVVCGLGVGSYFEQWGFSSEQIHEEDWYTKIDLANDFAVYVLPARHFSGRLLKQNQTEWASFAIVTKQQSIFYSGDGGYGKHFKEIGQMFEGFDLALMEDGQYNEDWPQVHMMPEETAQAAVDLEAKAVIPAHAGKFSLSKHPWQEPFERLTAVSKEKPYRLLTPEIGEVVAMNNHVQKFSAWWQSSFQVTKHIDEFQQEGK